MGARNAKFHPSDKPRILADGKRRAESKVWDELAKLNSHWNIFYSARENNSHGHQREVDFVAIWYNRIFYIEVKGGHVDVHTAAGPSVLWNHQTQAGKELKPIDPTQLWDAKKALHQAIKEKCGGTPRQFGFTEYEVYIFPDTSRRVTQGQVHDNDTVRHFFAEDLSVLALKLSSIVRQTKATYVDRKQIRRVISRVSELSLQADRRMSTIKPDVAPAFRPRPENLESVVQDYPTVTSRVPIGVASSPRRVWRSVILGLGITAGALGLVWWNWDDVMKSVVSAPVAATKHGVPSSQPRPIQKPEQRDEGALPSFISRASASEVERAIEAAHDASVYVSWQTNAQHGFVILRSDDGNGCRQYQVSRHDIAPAKYATIRRCS